MGKAIFTQPPEILPDIQIKPCTQAAYDGMEAHDKNTLYIIVEEDTETTE